jgi:uncharacterized phiE125 gp8 family phage protein
MRLVLVSGPAVEPLTAAEAKERLNIGSEVSDAVMDAYIMAARQRIDGADGYLGRALITQTWQGRDDAFPTDDNGRIYIPLPPLQTVTISYLDSTGNSVVLVEGVDYRIVQAQRPYILPLSSWPSVTGIDGVTIQFVVGYGDAGADVPEPIRTAIALGAGHLRTMSMRNLTVTMEAEEGIGQTRYGVTAEIFTVLDSTVQSLLSTYRVIFV